MRPPKGKGIRRDKSSGNCRRRLQFLILVRLGPDLKFAGRCLAKLPFLRKRPHLLEVLTRIASPVSGSQVRREPFQERIAVLGPSLAALFEFDDPASEFVVGDGHHSIDDAGGGRAGLIEQTRDAIEQDFVVLARDDRNGLRLRFSFGHCRGIASQSKRYHSVEVRAVILRKFPKVHVKSRAPISPQPLARPGIFRRMPLRFAAGGAYSKNRTPWGGGDSSLQPDSESPAIERNGEKPSRLRPIR